MSVKEVENMSIANIPLNYLIQLGEFTLNETSNVSLVIIRHSSIILLKMALVAISPI